MGESNLNAKTYTGFPIELFVEFPIDDCIRMKGMVAGKPVDLRYHPFHRELTGKFGDREVKIGPVSAGEITSEMMRHPDWNVWCLFDSYVNLHNAAEALGRGF